MSGKKIMLSTLGRCGSKYFFKNLDKNNINMLSKAGENHWYPDNLAKKAKKRGCAPPNLKVIFLFADPCEIILSVKKRERDMGIAWVEKHFRNLNADFNDYQNIFKKDSLRLERMFDSFYRQQKFELLTVRYETLSENIDVISDFFGQKFSLKIPYVKRPLKLASLSSGERKIILKTYDRLLDKILNADDIKIWRPK